MIRAVKSGTGRRAALDNGYVVAGKTGPQEASNDKGRRRHTPGSSAMSSTTTRRMPFVYWLKMGGSGGSVAAPLARKTLQKAINLGL